jgi:hypothetical protein
LNWSRCRRATTGLRHPPERGRPRSCTKSIASAEKGVPAAAKDIAGHTFLYIEVEKLDPIIAALKGVDIVLPLRTTFYGAKEIGVKDSAGYMVVLAEMAAPQH